MLWTYWIVCNKLRSIVTTPPKAYYNENDPFAAAWLRNLIAAGLIADGEVDERSIEDVFPIDLVGYTQCHFFAGIGGWSYAARLAGWDDSRPLWTGSCPCQPFSAAGKRGGMSDERHLWPALFHLIQNGKPRDVPVFGEQVASPDGLAWLDLVQADLEGTGHACWATDICAAGFGAPIIRQRLWWLACTKHANRRPERVVEPLAYRRDGSGWSGDPGRMARTDDAQRRPGVARGDEFDGRQTGWLKSDSESGTGCEPIRMGSSGGQGLQKRLSDRRIPQTPVGTHTKKTTERRDEFSWMAASSSKGSLPGAHTGIHCGEEISGPRNAEPERYSTTGERPGPTNGFWRDTDWLLCRDDKWRPVEPGTQPLAHGLQYKLASVLAIEQESAQEVIKYAKYSQTNTDQVLRMVRDFFQSQESRERPTIGMCRELHETPLLLSFLLSVEATCNGASFGSGWTKTREQAHDRAMRLLRVHYRDRSSPREWKPEGQLSEQSPNSVRELSWVLARLAKAYEFAAIETNASLNRTGALRGFGNAINAEAAAEVLKAYMDCYPES
jgi:DNA (cytosine-5)-methyltransferase 1